MLWFQCSQFIYLLYWAQLCFSAYKALVSSVLNICDLHWATREHRTQSLIGSQLSWLATALEKKCLTKLSNSGGFLIQSLLLGLQICLELPNHTSAFTTLLFALSISVGIKSRDRMSPFLLFCPLHVAVLSPQHPLKAIYWKDERPVITENWKL